MAADQTREGRLNQLEQKVRDDYVELFGSCAQGTLLALQEQFNLGDSHTLKAAAAMPGIALRERPAGPSMADFLRAWAWSRAEIISDSSATCTSAGKALLRRAPRN